VAATDPHWRILDAVRQAVVDLALEGIPARQVYLRKAPYGEDVGKPAVIVWPGGTEELYGPASSMKARETGYPAAVTFVPANERSPQLTEPEMVWRRSVLKRFLDGPDLVADGRPWRCTVEPGPIVDPDLWVKTGWFTGGVLLRFWGVGG
jgi:hypothetical protein